MKKNKSIKFLGLIFCNIAIVALVFELFLRIDYFEQTFLLQETQDPRVVLHPNPMLEHIFKPSKRFRSTEPSGEDITFETNKLGLREKEILPKKNNEIIVLFLGDSMVAGSQVKKELIMSSISEKILNAFAKEKKLNLSFRTINGGIDGYNLINSLENYKRISKTITPDIVVLGVFLSNDVMQYSKYFSTKHKIKYVVLKNSYTLRMLKVLKSHMQLYMAKSDNRNIQHNTTLPAYDTILDRHKLSLLYSKYFPHTSSLIKENTFLSESYPQRSLDWIKDSIIEEHVLAKLSLTPLPESYYQSTANVIKLIHNEVTKNHIPLLTCLFPVPTAYDDNELNFVLEYNNLKKEIISRDRPQEILKQALKDNIDKQHLKLIDFTTPLSVGSKDKSSTTPMGCHFNAQGHQVVGKVIATEISNLTQRLEVLKTQ